MMPADEHRVTINNENPRSPGYSLLACATCHKGFSAPTQALATKTHRQHVAATDLAKQENSR